MKSLTVEVSPSEKKHNVTIRLVPSRKEKIEQEAESTRRNQAVVWDQMIDLFFSLPPDQRWKDLNDQSPKRESTKRGER